MAKGNNNSGGSSHPTPSSSPGGSPPGAPSGAPSAPVQQSAGGGSSGIFGFIHHHISYLNSSKFFAGLVMILLNVGSKFIPIQFSKSAEEYLKMSLAKQILVFAMAWMGTRDIYTALVLTAVFTILSDHLFNDESHYCVVPHHKRVLNKMLKQNKDDKITDEEVQEAKNVLAKAEKQRRDNEKNNALKNFSYWGGAEPP